MPLKTVSAGPYRSASRRSSSTRALNQSFADDVPLVGGDQQGNEIQAPGPVQTIRIAVNIVRDAVLVNQPAAPGRASGRNSSGFRSSSRETNSRQCGRRDAVGLHHFIGEWGIESVIVGEAASQRMISFDAARRCRSLHICDSRYSTSVSDPA